MGDESTTGSLDEEADVERDDVVADSSTSSCASWRTCSCCSCCSAMWDRVPDERKKQATSLMVASRRVWLVGDVVSDAVVVASIPRKRFPNTFRAAIAIIIFPAVVLLCAFYGPLRQEVFDAGDDEDPDARLSVEDAGEVDEEKGTHAPASPRQEVFDAGDDEDDAADARLSNEDAGEADEDKTTDAQGPTRQEVSDAGDDDEDADAHLNIEDAGEADEENGANARVSTKKEDASKVPCRRQLAFFVGYVLLGFPAIVFIDIALATCCLRMKSRPESKFHDKLLRYERARRITESLLESTLQTCLQIYLFTEKEVDALTIAIAFVFSLGNLIYLMWELCNEATARAKADGRMKASFVDFFNHVVFVIALGLGSSMVEYVKDDSSDIAFDKISLTRREFRELCKRISNSKVVTSLSLYACRLTGTLHPLAHATSLTKLNLGWNKFEGDLEPLRSHTNLIHLDLYRCNIQGDLKPLRNHTTLTYLNLAGCKIQGDLEPLRHTNLRYLNLNCCKIQGDIEPLRNHTNLECLDLYCCNVHGDIEALRNHTNLQRLDLHGCNVHGDLELLCNHTDLTHLDLFGCSIHGVKEFGKAHPKCSVYYKDDEEYEGIEPTEPTEPTERTEPE